MARIESSVVIGRPLDDVYAYVSDLENDAKWQTGIEESRFTSGGPDQVGSIGRKVSRFLGRRIESTWEIAAADEGEGYKTVTIKSKSGPFPYEGTYHLESAEDATRLTLVGDADVGGFFKLGEPILVRVARRQTESELQKLKDILESEEEES